VGPLPGRWARRDAHGSSFWYDELQTRVLSSRFHDIRPSSVAIAAIATVALVAGWALNATLVPGQYEWFGLFRIFWDVSHRAGFWVLCLPIWLAGVANAPTMRHVFSRASRQTLAIWLAISIAVLAFVRTMPAVVRVGSLPDAICFAFLVPGFVIHALAAPGSWGDRFCEVRRLVLTAVIALTGCTLAGYVHTMLKGALFVATDPRDEILWAADAHLLGARFYEQVAAFRHSHPTLVRVLDLVYIGLIQQLWWSLFYFYGAKRLAHARPYLLAMLIVYTVGPLAYYLIPSRGPVFVHPELFLDLAVLAPDSRYLARLLLGQTALTGAGSSHPIAPFCFIAAMPSLHVAQSLVMLIGMRRSAFLCVFNGSMFLLTVVATTLLGWHYFVDDLAGVVLGFGCWCLAIGIVWQDSRADKAATSVQLRSGGIAGGSSR